MGVFTGASLNQLQLAGPIAASATTYGATNEVDSFRFFRVVPAQ